MSQMTTLFAVLGTIFIGAASPGPSFVYVSRLAVVGSRSDGVIAAMGMGLGGTVFATLALGGLTTLLLHASWVFGVIKVLSGVYLIYLGVRMWKDARNPIVAPQSALKSRRSDSGTFGLALLVQVSNPKAVIVYTSVFAAFLPAEPSPWLLFSLPPLIFIVEAGWYTIVAVSFSSDSLIAIYGRAKALIDRTTGTVIGAIGARLLLQGVSGN